ncbi:hypothetical protein KM043_002006 [Ampulex compressa]|nr:hypothetical protein KM043_002006 [Ampulex compressa]
MAGLFPENSEKSLAEKTGLDLGKRGLIGVPASRLILGLAQRFRVPTAIVPFLSAPSISSFLRESPNRRAVYPVNWWHFCGRAIKWFQAISAKKIGKAGNEPDFN